MGWMWTSSTMRQLRGTAAAAISWQVGGERQTGDTPSNALLQAMQYMLLQPCTSTL